MATPSQQQQRIIVIGAGYAGLLFTARLAGKVRARRASVTLVNESPTFTERLRLHQYATNHNIQWRPIARQLRGCGVAFVQGRVTNIDTERREILAEGPEGRRVLPYDYLVYALGSHTDTLRVPGVAEFAYTLAPDGPLSAAALRERLPGLAEQHARIVVCGGGPTGIETAAEIASAYPALRVRLVTQGALGMFLGAGVAAYIRRSLTRLGVEITDATSVVAVRADGVLTDDDQIIPADLCVWAGGFVASPLARAAGLPVNERDQALIDPYMRVVGHPEIYAIGDAAYPQDEPGVHVRMAAGNAVILAAHAADCLSAVLRGKRARPLSFAYLGQAIALGRGNAIGFNNYPDDHPHRPYFTGRLAFRTREVFVRYLANTARFERRFPGSFTWPGKRRYAKQLRNMSRDASMPATIPQRELVGSGTGASEPRGK